MTRSAELQVAINQIAVASRQLSEMRMRLVSKHAELQNVKDRLTRIKLMMRQFRVQANSIPEGDPVRIAFEGFIMAVEQLADGADIAPVQGDH